MVDTDSDDVASAMNALSHPRRMAIFKALEIAGLDGLGFDAMVERNGLQLSALRNHLRPMLAAGLVARRRLARTWLSFSMAGRSPASARRLRTGLIGWRRRWRLRSPSRTER